MNKKFTKTAPSTICLGESANFLGDFVRRNRFFAAFTETAYLNTSLAETFEFKKGDEIV
jgi:hypothetical protein